LEQIQRKIKSIRILVFYSFLLYGRYNFIFFRCDGNANLNCINVDDAAWSNTNWTQSSFTFDSQHYFSNNCPPLTLTQEYTKNNKPFKVADLLGRETKGKKNKPLFYIYDDGSVEKKIIIE